MKEIKSVTDMRFDELLHRNNYKDRIKKIVEKYTDAYDDWTDFGVATELAWRDVQIEQLQARIKELESQSHINEIKAQVIEEFIDNHPPYERPMGTLDDGTMVSWYCYNIGHLTDYIKKLRAKHD